jgi:D-3-phosphoglycerate dehydrogenase
VTEKVLVNRPIHPVALRRLSEEVEVLTPFGASNAEILDILPDVNGFLLCAGNTLSAAEMDRAAKLRVIGRHGVGLDNVDVAAATERGIPVVYTPYGPTESTAEHALMLMLATARRLAQLDRAVRGGDFGIRNRFEAMGHELRGKALGVVGFGRIGRRLAEMCRGALHMSVYVFDPYLDPEDVAAWGATPVAELIELAGMVDVLSLHVPLTAETDQLVDRDVIGAMKPDAILINASRGAVVDEAALIEALEKGRLFGAGLDVYDPEPPAADHPLFQCDRVVLTPHVASLTDEGRRLMGLTVVEDILRVLRGDVPEYLANSEVWTRRRAVTGL